MPRTLLQRHTLSVGATRVVRVNATSDLDDGASLTGTPTVEEQTTSDLTLDNKAVTSSSYTDETGSTIAAGKAVLFTVAGGSAGTQYRVRVTCGTDSSPAETLVYDVLLDWE